MSDSVGSLSACAAVMPLAVKKASNASLVGANSVSFRLAESVLDLGCLAENLAQGIQAGVFFNLAFERVLIARALHVLLEAVAKTKAKAKAQRNDDDCRRDDGSQLASFLLSGIIEISVTDERWRTPFGGACSKVRAAEQRHGDVDVEKGGGSVCEILL